MQFLANQTFWGMYATWLVESYTIAAGDINEGLGIGIGAAHAAWSGAIDTARKACVKLKGDDAKDAKSGRCARARASRHACRMRTLGSLSSHARILISSFLISRISQEWFKRLKEDTSDEGEWSVVTGVEYNGRLWRSQQVNLENKRDPVLVFLPTALHTATRPFTPQPRSSVCDFASRGLVSWAKSRAGGAGAM